MTILYEWDVEEVDRDSGDILNHNHGDKLSWLLPAFGNIITQGRGDLVLVRDEGNNTEGLLDRHWAYVKDGVLPEYFADSMGENTSIRVPQRFHRELARQKETTP